VTDAAFGSSHTPRPRTSAGAAAFVLYQDKLLMIRQERRTGMRWEVPGGGQEPGETLEETAVRETQEEAGARIVVERLVCTYASYRLHSGSVVLGAFYLATAVDPTAVLRPQEDDGIVEATWADPRSLDEGEFGPLTQRALSRWWPYRYEVRAPFHVELWRDRTGYLPG
jgi:8-oxo-dGTP pyrophosphatase MutT (NUDIX family)